MGTTTACAHVHNMWKCFECVFPEKQVEVTKLLSVRREIRLALVIHQLNHNIDTSQIFMIDIVPSKEVCDFMFLHINLRLEPVHTFALYGSAPTAVIVATLVTECPSVEAVLAPPVSGTTSNSRGQLVARSDQSADGYHQP